MSSTQPFILALLLLFSFWAIAYIKQRGSFTSNQLVFKDALFGIKLLLVVAFMLGLVRHDFLLTNSRDRFPPGDIMIVVDISPIMAAEDFYPSRFQVVKEEIAALIKRRKKGNLGIVVFTGETKRLCSLSQDYSQVLLRWQEITPEQIPSGNALLPALLNSLQGLKKSKADNKLIILISSIGGQKDKAQFQAVTRMATSLGAIICSIGVGKDGGIPIPINDPVFGRIYLRQLDGSLVLTYLDETLLRELAALNGGDYFRVSNRKDLHQILTQIVD